MGDSSRTRKLNLWEQSAAAERKAQAGVSWADMEGDFTPFSVGWSGTSRMHQQWDPSVLLRAHNALEERYQDLERDAPPAGRARTLSDQIWGDGDVGLLRRAPRRRFYSEALGGLEEDREALSRTSPSRLPNDPRARAVSDHTSMEPIAERGTSDPELTLPSGAVAARTRLLSKNWFGDYSPKTTMSEFTPYGVYDTFDGEYDRFAQAGTSSWQPPPPPGRPQPPVRAPPGLSASATPPGRARAVSDLASTVATTSDDPYGPRSRTVSEPIAWETALKAVGRDFNFSDAEETDSESDEPMVTPEEPEEYYLSPKSQLDPSSPLEHDSEQRSGSPSELSTVPSPPRDKAALNSGRELPPPGLPQAPPVSTMEAKEVVPGTSSSASTSEAIETAALEEVLYEQRRYIAEQQDMIERQRLVMRQEQMLNFQQQQAGQALQQMNPHQLMMWQQQMKVQSLYSGEQYAPQPFAPQMHNMQFVPQSTWPAQQPQAYPGEQCPPGYGAPFGRMAPPGAPAGLAPRGSGVVQGGMPPRIYQSQERCRDEAASTRGVSGGLLPAPRDEQPGLLGKKVTGPDGLTVTIPHGHSVAVPRKAVGARRKRGKFTCRYLIPAAIANDTPFRVTSYLIGKGGTKMRSISEETDAKLRIRGKNSGHYEGPKMAESDDPLQVCISAPTEHSLSLAKARVEGLFQAMFADYKTFRPGADHENYAAVVVEP